jgi:hypothetical protein
MAHKKLHETLLKLPGSNRLKEIDFILKIMRFAPNLPLLTRGADRDECAVVVANAHEKMSGIRRSPQVEFVTLAELPTHFIGRSAVPLMIEQHALETLVFEAARDLKLMSCLAELVALWEEYDQSTKEAISRMPVKDRELLGRRADQINALLDQIADQVNRRG